MFKLKNGILYSNDVPQFTLGQSYWASYHEQKIPVSPSADRNAEMKKDLEQMANSGFNLVRMAALGEVKRAPDGSVAVDFPFIDQVVEHAEKANIAAMVRLHGYSFNLGNYTDAIMLDQYNNELKFYWAAFVRNCLNHPGIIKDNAEATVASAEHFKQHPAVVSFQIYNEPSYFPPAWPHLKEMFDYNPHSIRAWRKWLVERGIKTEDEVVVLDAPRCHPSSDEDPADWINWCLFKTERMNDFLNDLSDKAKEGHSVPETMTCNMPCPIWPKAAVRGEDYFRVAERMDVVGITHYIRSMGMVHYSASAVIDLAESAAAVYGKHAWIVEYNCRTDLSANEWERETFSAIGSGVKGIIYYQWRADYPFPGCPEPELFGMIFNDGRKTIKYDRAVALNMLIAEIGRYFVAAEKERSGVAVLFSEYANAWSNAKCDRWEPSIFALHQAYTSMRKVNVAVDFVRTKDLAENTLGVKLLIIPFEEGLSQTELDEIKAFEESGGKTVKYGLESADFEKMSAEEVLEYNGIRSLFECTAKKLDIKILRARDNSYIVISLINIDSFEKTVSAGEVLKLPESVKKSGFLK